VIREKDTGLVKQARAVTTRQQIVAAAAATFDRLSFDGASLGAIVEAGEGLTKGSLYFHFKSKNELAEAVVERQHEISIAAVEAIAETGASALEQIVMLCHEMGRQIMEDPIVRAGIRLTLEFSVGDGPGGLAAPYRDWIDACRRLAEKAIDEGDLRATIEPAELARFVISAFTGVQMVSNVLDRRIDLEERIDQMWQFLLPGISSPARRRKSEKIRQARWNREQETN
jgi:AcrR family transcriptional regulator